jgi:hypothetical protein
MIIGVVRIDRGLRLSCPYGRGTLTVRLDVQLLAATVVGAGSALAFLAAGAPPGPARVLISVLLVLLTPVGTLLVTGWFLRDQLRGRPGPEGNRSGGRAGALPGRPDHGG